MSLVWCYNQAWLQLHLDRTVSRPGSNPATVTSLRNFGNSAYPALPVSFGGDTKSRRSLLSGVYARGSKRSHQSALECVTVVDSTTHSKLPDPQSAIMRRKTLPCTCIGRRRRRIFSDSSSSFFQLLCLASASIVSVFYILNAGFSAHVSSMLTL